MSDRELLQRVSDWSKKYPSGRIYDHSTIKKIAAEHDAIVADIDARLAENDELLDKAIRFDLDQLGIALREKEAIELVELRAENAALKDRVRDLLARVDARLAEREGDAGGLADALSLSLNEPIAGRLLSDDDVSVNRVLAESIYRILRSAQAGRVSVPSREFGLLSTWWAMTEAGNELDGSAPFEDDQIILNYSGNGASCFLTVGDIRKLLAASQKINAGQQGNATHGASSQGQSTPSGVQCEAVTPAGAAPNKRSEP